MKRNGRYFVAMACGLSLALPAPALADAPAPPAAPTADGAASPVSEASAAVPSATPVALPPERPFLFSTDPSLPEPGHVIVTAGIGNVTKTGEERPAGPGSTVIPTAGVEVGALSRLSFYLDTGVVFWNNAPNTSPVTLDTGARILLTSPTSEHVHLVLQPSYGLDYFGNSTLLLTATFAYNYGILRVIASATGSHTFQDGSDPVDVEASVGASVKLPLGFLVGLEGVVTDLEEIASAGAEGGSSAYAGPTVGWEWSHRLQVVLGPAYGGGPNYYQGFIYKAAVAAHF